MRLGNKVFIFSSYRTSVFRGGTMNVSKEQTVSIFTGIDLLQNKIVAFNTGMLLPNKI